jgi:hypothetical protein
MIRKIFGVMLFTAIVITTNAQEKADTVIVSLAKTSKVIFTIQDRNDLEILKHYNFQDLFQDILKRIEKTDSLSTTTSTSDTLKTESPVVTEETRHEDWSSTSTGSNDEESENDDAWEQKVAYRKGRIGRTWQSFNFDLGTNNYLSDGKFPDADNALYSVRPWGSWYLAASSIQRTRAGKNFFLEWGLGVSWYNFKFQNDNTMIEKTDNGIEFVADTRDVRHIKSKLSASYINASLVPVLDFGGHGKKARMWDGYQSAFRIGLGPYIGYRVASRSKLVYNEDGNRQKDKERNNLYLNNIRYGARLQLGFRSTDFFFNYDMNELFATGKGPKLNAFSFGVIF